MSDGDHNLRERLEELRTEVQKKAVQLRLLRSMNARWKAEAYEEIHHDITFVLHPPPT